MKTWKNNVDMGRRSRALTGYPGVCVSLFSLFLFLSTPLAAQDRQLNLVFPQFANGEVGGVRNSSRVILRNNGERVETGKVTFLDSSGEMNLIPVDGELIGFVNYAIEPWGVWEMQTDGTGPLKFGPVEVVSDQGELSTLDGTIVFELLGNLVSVSSCPLRSANQTFVSFNSSENSGLAVYNPDWEKSATLELTLLDHKGEEVAATELTLPAATQRAIFVDSPDLFADFFGNLEEAFSGTLHIVASEGARVAVLGLIQRRSDGALSAVPVSEQVFNKPT